MIFCSSAASSYLYSSFDISESKDKGLAQAKKAKDSAAIGSAPLSNCETVADVPYLQYSRTLSGI